MYPSRSVSSTSSSSSSNEETPMPQMSSVVCDDVVHDVPVAAVPLPTWVHLVFASLIFLAGAGLGIGLKMAIEEEPDNFIVGIVVFLVCCAIAFVYVCRKLKACARSSNLRKQSSDAEGVAMREHLGSESSISTSQTLQASAVASKRLELKEGEVLLETALKRGNFGEVWRGHFAATGEVVAIKVLPANTKSVLGMEDLVAEINVMRHVRDKGSHCNVMELRGFQLTMPPQLVLEFIETGSLEEFLTTMRNNDVPIEVPVCKDFALQVARGMKFVADAGVVHRDLASRNILITADHVLKIADFGLARKVGSKGFFTFKQGGYCIKKESNPTAFRWTPPEGFKETAKASAQVGHTEKGDVWSFAVVMMEICTRGSTPYESDIRESNKQKVILFVFEGKRMAQGPMPDDLYSLAKRCWEMDLNDRPTFAQIIKDLEGKGRGTNFVSFAPFGIGR